LIGGRSGLRVIQRAGINCHHAPQELGGEDALFLLREGFESLQELDRLVAHDLRLPD
jgi:hypothetical protein